MGRSRGGLTTKIHALVDASGLPIALKLTEGQAHDGRAAADMLDSLGRGPHPARPIAPTISTPCAKTLPHAALGPTSNPCPTGAPSPAFSSFLYRYRNLVERFFNKLKHFRAVATRYDKSPDNYPRIRQTRFSQEFGCALMSRWPSHVNLKFAA